MQQLEDTEEIFYENQRNTQKCRPSEVFDKDYETDKELNSSKQVPEAELDEIEDSFINDTSLD